MPQRAPGRPGWGGGGAGPGGGRGGAGGGAASVLADALGHGAGCRARLWLAAEDVETNPEAGLRPGRDARLGTILVVEGSDAGRVRVAAEAAAARLGVRGAVGVYGLLHARDAAA